MTLAELLKENGLTIEELREWFESDDFDRWLDAHAVPDDEDKK